MSCYVYTTIYVMFICLYNHLMSCLYVYITILSCLYDNHLWHDMLTICHVYVYTTIYVMFMFIQPFMSCT